ncbi:hypothetical protein LSTR_LSTR009189 [Laodelphax striatellus]|uniref:Activator 1 large subunit n=1 Tax=Laodelphax striatellus TaxID=195883 RepID=A0A482XD97_LAOST|nr:hypothetical protein LSTR_LSTR009189 [Laodelphax striatellus]
MDIRNFFRPSPSSKSVKSIEPEKKKKAKKIIISDSESDDDSPKITTSKQKDKSPSVNKTKPVNGVEKSKYFKPAKPEDVFSCAPVKQTAIPKPTKKSSEIEANNDDDDGFDEMFLQLNDDVVEEMIKEATGKSISNEKHESDEKQKKTKDTNGEKKSAGKEKKEKSSDKGKQDSSPLRKSPKENKESSSSRKSHKEKHDSSPSRKSHKEKHNSSPSKTDHKTLKVESNGLSKYKSKELRDNKTEKTSNSVINLSDSDSDGQIKIDERKMKKGKLEEKNKSESSRKESKKKSSPEKIGTISSEKKSKSSPVVEKVETAKNTCIDMSDSGSSDDEIQIKSPQKRKVEPDTTTASPKRRKIEEMKLDTGLKRKSDNMTPPRDSKKPKTDSSQSASSVSSLSQASSSSTSAFFDRPRPQASQLWVDKYKPASMKQLIGQQGEKSVAKKLTHWLSRWHANHSGNKKLQRPSPWAKDDDGAFFKAALLSGPPGIGKTTTAHLVCKELGFDMVEFNASDTRSKKLLHQEVSELLSSKSLAPFFTGGSGGGGGGMTRNHVLVMDEVDGMAGNEDRGGIQELIQLVKSAHVPIICMCNDRNHPKMRSLVNYCFDLRVSRPRVEQIKGAMMSICFKEGLKIAPDKLNDIIKSTDQDIRLILNHLSVLAANKDSQLPNSEKFVKLGPWDVLRKVFSEEDLKKMTFNEKSDLFFHDYSIAPLFVQENYLNVVPHAKLNKKEKMEAFAKAAESLCNGDLVDKTIRSRNAWSLLPVQAVFSSVVPGDVLKGHMGGQINFPAWLGKNSSKNKMDRLQQELLVHTRLRVSASKEAINLDYSQHLRDLIVRPLLEHGTDGVSQSLEALKNYDLLKDDLDSLTELCRWPNSKDPMAKVESKVKASFTRAYNKSAAPPPYAVAAVAKKGRGGGGGADYDLLLAEDGREEPMEAEVGDDDEDKDSIEVDAMIAVKKKTSKSQEKSEAASTSKGRGAGSKRGRGRGK